HATSSIAFNADSSRLTRNRSILFSLLISIREVLRVWSVDGNRATGLLPRNQPEEPGVRGRRNTDFILKVCIIEQRRRCDVRPVSAGQISALLQHEAHRGHGPG